MFYNFYFYLFIFSIIFGSFISFIGQAYKAYNRKEIISAFINSLLLRLIIALSFLIIGFAIGNLQEVKLVSASIFSLITVISFTFLHFYLKVISFFIVGFVLLLLIFTSGLILKGYDPLFDDIYIEYSVLKVKDDSVFVDVSSNTGNVESIITTKNELLPQILEYSFTPLLFFLGSTEYYTLNSFSSISEHSGVTEFQLLPFNFLYKVQKLKVPALIAEPMFNMKYKISADR